MDAKKEWNLLVGPYAGMGITDQSANVAIGVGAWAEGGSVAIGNGAKAYGNNSMAIGHGVIVTGDRSHVIEVTNWYEFFQEIREAVTTTPPQDGA